MTHTPRDWDELEDVARDVVAGNASAWQAFFAGLERLGVPVLKRQWMRLRPGAAADATEDAARDLLLRVVEKLQRDNYRTLRSSDALNPEATGKASLRSFLTTVLIRAAIDYQRTHPAYQRPSQARSAASIDGADATRWVGFAELHSSVFGERPPMTKQQDAIQMLSFLDAIAERAAVVHSEHVYGLRGRKQADAARAAYDVIANEIGDLPWTIGRHLVAFGPLYRTALELELQDRPQVAIAEHIGLTRRQTEIVLQNAKLVLRARFASGSSVS